MDTPTLALSPASGVASPDPYVVALDAASESLGIAIRSCLEGKGVWRFAEVQRLCKIGQAIMRMRARANPTVGAYVDPAAAPPNGLANCGIGGVNPFGADDGLGLDDPAQMDPAMGVYGPAYRQLGPMMNPVFPAVGAPNLGRVAQGPVDGMMEMLRGTLASIEGNDNKRSQLDLLEELRSLGELLKKRDLAPPERTVLQARREEIIATIAAKTELDRRAREGKAIASEPTQVRHARCDACGAAHDQDWITRDGRLRACDVCGGPMRWSDEAASRPALPPALDSEEKPSPPAPKENETPCPPSSPRTSGTSRRRTATSASKRSTSAKRSSSTSSSPRPK